MNISCNVPERMEAHREFSFRRFVCLTSTHVSETELDQQVIHVFVALDQAFYLSREHVCLSVAYVLLSAMHFVSIYDRIRGYHARLQPQCTLHLNLPLRLPPRPAPFEIEVSSFPSSSLRSNRLPSRPRPLVAFCSALSGFGFQRAYTYCQEHGL